MIIGNSLFLFPLLKCRYVYIAKEMFVANVFEGMYVYLFLPNGMRCAIKRVHPILLTSHGSTSRLLQCFIEISLTSRHC